MVGVRHWGRRRIPKLTELLKKEKLKARTDPGYRRTEASLIVVYGTAITVVYRASQEPAQMIVDSSNR